jgi:tyrosine-protein kinase Etk/Wzc
MEDQFQAAKVEQDGLTFKELLLKYLRFLPLFVISLALALLVAYVYLRYTTPIYQSSGALIVKEDNGSSSGNSTSDRFQQMFVLDNSINVKNEIEILRSRPLMRRVVEDLNLNITYFVIGKIKESNIYTTSPLRIEIYEITDSSNSFALPIVVQDNKTFSIGERKILFGEKFENEFGIFRLNYNPVATLSKEYRIVWSSTPSVINQVISKLTVAPGASAGVIQISFEATNPQLAADVIDQLMKEYQVATREDKNETNRRMLEFIDDRMKNVEHELDSVTGSLLRYQRDNNLLNSEAQSGNFFAKLEKTDDAINEQRLQDNVAVMIDNYISDQANAFNLVPSTLGLGDATLSTLIGAYNVAQLERKALIDANTPITNVKVRQKESEIERLRINIRESLQNLRKSIAALINRLEQRNSAVLTQVRSLPLKEQALLEIKTQQQTKQTIYNLLLEKREQTQISLAGTISNMKVIEEATVDPIPIKPKPSNVYLISFIAGFALPALFVFGIELFNDKVTGRNDIEKVTSVPIVGEIGHSYLGNNLIVKPNQRSIVAEQFRIIRSNLQYILANSPKPVILVTSSFSGEGKSFLSTNLGAVLSLANKKTIILEFDIRKPKILSHLGLPKKPGITNFLLGTVKLEDLAVPVPGYDNLFVLPCGPIPPNPAELLLDPKLDELFAYLKQHFDTVVIDTAPVGMVSDAMSLSRFADCTLYMVRQGHTYKKQVLLIDEFHSEKKLPKVSIVLNDVKAQTRYGYYGYGRYGYGYGYGAKSGYFTEDAPPPTMFDKWFGWMDMKKWERKKTKI